VIDAYLASLEPLGMRFGLDRVQRALADLGHPERAYPILQVGGTNGKGSTCAMAEAALRAAGHRTGLHASPHLVRFNERIRIDGEEIADAGLEAAAA
jgi:dihydrofolate synthase/folylpolyglutamate synthase